MKAERQVAKESPPTFGGFTSPEVLWSEDGGSALFPSEVSALWFIRQHREELIAALAIARPLRHLVVHPQRFAAVWERIAVQRAATAAADRRAACIE